MGVGLKARQVRGLFVLPRKDFRPALGAQAVYGCLYPSFLLSDVFDIPYRDMYDRECIL